MTVYCSNTNSGTNIPPVLVMQHAFMNFNTECHQITISQDIYIYITGWVADLENDIRGTCRCVVISDQMWYFYTTLGGCDTCLILSYDVPSKL